MTRIQPPLLIAALLSLAAFSAAAQQIYKTVDEDGNVIYTDEPPTPDAQPMDLPPITVADPYAAPARPEQPEGERPERPVALYPDLAFISPVAEEHFWGTGGTFTAQLGSAQSLLAGHQVRFYLDGQAVGTESGYIRQFAGVDRGEHAVSAEILDEAGQVVARAGPVVFYMRQNSILHRKNAGRGAGG